MDLAPSAIYYSQDSISPYFDKRSTHSHKRIGETLDDICEGRCSRLNIPRISVIRENGRWITADNRRLWVFRHLERLGKCSQITVLQTLSIPDEKKTAIGGGNSVRVRGSPGGYWHNKSNSTPSYQQPVYPSYSYSSSTSSYTSSPVAPRRDYSSNRSSSYTMPSDRARVYSYNPDPPRQKESDRWCTIL